MSPTIVDIFTRNVSEALGLFALAGLMTTAFRWRKSRRPDLMVAFGVFLAGAALREVPLYLGGAFQWPVELVLLGGISRLTQVVGCILFIRATLRDECPPWGWKAVVAVVLLCAAAL
jgi:hypothetical protein